MRSKNENAAEDIGATLSKSQLHTEVSGLYGDYFSRAVLRQQAGCIKWMLRNATIALP